MEGARVWIPSPRRGSVVRCGLCVCGSAYKADVEGRCKVSVSVFVCVCLPACAPACGSVCLLYVCACVCTCGCLGAWKRVGRGGAEASPPGGNSVFPGRAPRAPWEGR